MLASAGAGGFDGSCPRTCWSLLGDRRRGGGGAWWGLLVGVVFGWLVLVAGASAASLGQAVDFPTPSSNSEPWAIASGPDGNIWFSEYSRIGVLEPCTPLATCDPVTREFTIPPSFGGTPDPSALTVGSDGNLWFNELNTNQIGVMVPCTPIATCVPTVRSFSTPSPGTAASVATGPDGNLWFTEDSNKIGVLVPCTPIATCTPIIRDFSVPTANSSPGFLAAGLDGNVWFTEVDSGRIGVLVPCAPIATCNPTVRDFSVPTANSQPAGIVSGPDGNVWFTESGSGRVGVLTPCVPIATCSPAVEDFALPTANSQPMSITVGPDGNLWVAESNANQIGMVTPCTPISSCVPTMREFQAPTSGGPSNVIGIAAGADGNMWFTELSAARIGVIGADVHQASILPPVVAGTAQAGTPQECEGASWSNYASQQPLSDLYPFDGFQWYLNGTAIGTGQSFTPTANDIGDQLSCAQTVTYALTGVTAVATSITITITQPPATGATGAIGATGATGPQGSQGPAGMVELVRCTTVTKTIRRKRTMAKKCTTRLISRPIQITTKASARAALSRGKRIIARGMMLTIANHADFLLRTSIRIPRGRYRLTITRKRTNLTARTTHMYIMIA